MNNGHDGIVELLAPETPPPHVWGDTLHHWIDELEERLSYADTREMLVGAVVAGLLGGIVAVVLREVRDRLRGGKP